MAAGSPRTGGLRALQEYGSRQPLAGPAQEREGHGPARPLPGRPKQIGVQAPLNNPLRSSRCADTFCAIPLSLSDLGYVVTSIALGPGLLDPAQLASTLGLLGVLAAVFAESGLLVGFFLPGDSLLFTTGLLLADGVLRTPLALAVALIVAAAITGDQVGFLLGRRWGPALRRRPDGRLFRRRHLQQAAEFFERRGPRTVVLARFVPVVRTFTPLVAGASGMSHRLFTTYNVIGGVLWGAGVTLLGHSLGQVALVRDHVELILLSIVAISLAPGAAALLRSRRQVEAPPVGKTHG